jgi:hypothetical protein
MRQINICFLLWRKIILEKNVSDRFIRPPGVNRNQGRFDRSDVYLQYRCDLGIAIRRIFEFLHQIEVNGCNSKEKKRANYNLILILFLFSEFK